MNKLYKNIILCIAALLMMLPMVIEASAEPAQAGNVAPTSAGVVESGSNSQEYASAIDPWCSTGPGGKCGPKEYWDRWGQEELKMTLPIEDNLMDPLKVTLLVIIDPVIEPPQDPGNDVGPCVIGTPSPCNAPEYWWPERWNWNWIHQWPPQITLPVEDPAAYPPELEALPSCPSCYKVVLTEPIEPVSEPGQGEAAPAVAGIAGASAN